MRGLIMAAQQQARAVPGIRPNYIYGLLYNWWAASDEKLGNSGFAVNSDPEWTEMSNYIEATYNQAPNNFGVGNHLKSCRQIDSPLGGDCDTSIHPRFNADGTQFGRNTVLFSGLPAGFRSNIFSGIGVTNQFWTTTESGGQYWIRRLLSSQATLFRSNAALFTPNNGYSLRLSKIATASEMNISEGQIIPNYYKGNNDFLYDCVRINDRIWTVQNLAETHWNDGTDIPFAGANGVNFTNAEWAALTTAGVCAYNNDVNTWGYTL